MSSKQEWVRQAIRERIAEERPGFVGRLASYRDLAHEFGVSTYVVFAALKMLEEEGVVACQPRKGAEVVGTSRPDARGGSVVDVLVCETFPWQTDFWYEAIGFFESRSPGVRVRPRFAVNVEASRVEFASGAGGNKVIVRATDAELARLAHVPKVPVAEILGRDEADSFLADLVSSVREGGVSFAAPYQMQPPGIVYRRAPGGDPPRVDWTWPECARWARDTYGRGSLTLNVFYALLESCGVHQPRVGSPDERLTAAQLSRLVSACAAFSITGALLPTDASEEVLAALFADGTVGAACTMSFTWPGLGAAPGGPVGVWPLPVEEGGVVHSDCVYAVMTGLEASPAAAAWFRFLLSKDFQVLQMERGLGVSPLASCQAEVARTPERFAHGFDRVVERLGPTHDVVVRFTEPSPAWVRLRDSLFGRIISPVIAGEIDEDAGHAVAAEIVRETEAEEERSRVEEAKRLLRRSFEASARR